ncbi:unnamed protein product [Ostreobium quekettii]|uniref:Uncharacterized protein n=1 Tax=Ostreobium quekettii TaxID=121088 RepID=A0A8S1J174_9CHLO|nr:unnamed protein product [Ostreobium quekettii]
MKEEAHAAQPPKDAVFGAGPTAVVEAPQGTNAAMDAKDVDTDFMGQRASWLAQMHRQATPFVTRNSQRASKDTLVLGYSFKWLPRGRFGQKNWQSNHDPMDEIVISYIYQPVWGKALSVREMEELNIAIAGAFCRIGIELTKHSTAETCCNLFIYLSTLLCTSLSIVRLKLDVVGDIIGTCP